jgi:hypothetical protein
MAIHRRGLLQRGRKPPCGSVVDLDDPIADQMRAAFLFNEGSGKNAYNATGAPVTASGPVGLLSAISWKSGRGGLALAANAAFVDIGLTAKPAALNLTGPCTVLSLINLTANTGLQAIAADSNNTAALIQWGLYQDNGKIYVIWANVDAVIGTATLSAAKWYSVGGVRSGSAGAWTATSWINGILDNTGTTATNPSAQQGAAIGRSGNDVSFGLSGLIEYVYIWNRALTPGEILRVHGDPYGFIQWPKRSASLVLSAPGAPTGLTANYGSATSVTLTFVQGSGTVTDNPVAYGINGVSFPSTFDPSSATTSITVTGLTYGQLYFFKVAASNSGGTSGYSNVVAWVCGCNAGTQVAASNADAFENTLGTVTITDATDTLVALDYLGFYFTTNFPAGSDVSLAFLVINLASITGIAGSVSIDMQNAIPSVFAATSMNISSRPVTGDSVAWPISGLSSGWNQSPNFASACDDVLNNPAWTSNSSLAVIVKGLVGAAGFDAQMFDGNTALAAYLFVAYTAPGADQSGEFGDTMGMMAASNVLVLESQQTTFIGY